MRRHGARQTVERISAFEDRHDAPARVLARDADRDTGELCEILIGQREAAERIAGARIEAGGDHHELRLESIRRRHQRLAKDAENLFAAGSGGKWIVDDETAAFALTILIRTAGARIPR